MPGAKRGEIESGLGQCAAQMVGASAFNERAGTEVKAVFGAVTTGQAWQFLRLAAVPLTLNPYRLFIDDLGRILAALRGALRTAAPAAQ